MPDIDRVVILGPTAGGKSEIALLLAERLRDTAEVIGADSRQIYRGLEVGTSGTTSTIASRRDS